MHELWSLKNNFTHATTCSHPPSPHHSSEGCKATLLVYRACNSTLVPSSYIPENEMTGEQQEAGNYVLSLNSVKQTGEETNGHSQIPLLCCGDAACSDTSQSQCRNKGVPLLPATRRGTLWYSSCSHCASLDATFQHVGEMPDRCVTRSSPRES